MLLMTTFLSQLPSTLSSKHCFNIPGLYCGVSEVLMVLSVTTAGLVLGMSIWLMHPSYKEPSPVQRKSHLLVAHASKHCISIF